ncbi:acidic endochitinase-like [Vigna radiata var. radiata]|uniref:Acidic endochitinase-like n=1 Tax=Vigna radiata var. radiata TaxID=3916 RepID=A0A3Q0ENN6_VIGRR|nr:acidic endochitinase-like [Vigna radiata var. radiata]
MGFLPRRHHLSMDPSVADVAVERLSGYDTVTNIINGGLECDKGQDSRMEDHSGSSKDTVICLELVMATTLTATPRPHSEIHYLISIPSSDLQPPLRFLIPN